MKPAIPRWINGQTEKWDEADFNFISPGQVTKSLKLKTAKLFKSIIASVNLYICGESVFCILINLSNLSELNETLGGQLTG